MDDNKTIDVVIDGAFGLVSSTISILRPSLGILAMALSPALSEKVKTWLKTLVNQDKITPREYARLEDGLNGMKENLEYLGKKNEIRQDGLLEPHMDGFCDGDDIFEMMLNQIKLDSEKKKSYFYGIFIGNIPYKSDLDYSSLVQYSRIVNQLSYSELCLIRVFYSCFKDNALSFAKAEESVKQIEDPYTSMTLSEILHLRNLGLLIKCPPYTMSENIGKVKLSFSGIRLYEYLRLDLLDVNDVNKSESNIMRITQVM